MSNGEISGSYIEGMGARWRMTEASEGFGSLLRL
jgi:hypothetical protein